MNILSNCLILTLFAMVTSFSSNAQVKIKIHDAEYDEPLAGVHVYNESSQHISDIYGEIELSVSDEERFILTHLGYVSDTIYIHPSIEEIKLVLIPHYKQLEQIIIRGPLLQNTTLKSPGSIGILGIREISQGPNISYLEKLNRIPGVFAHTGTLNTNRVTIRGIGSRTPFGTNRVKALYNEIPITSGDGSTSLEDIDPWMINTIKIMKGGKSAVYGSGLGGIILISGQNYLNDGFHGKVMMEYGSFGTVKPALNIQFKKNNFSTSLAYSLSDTDGWRQNSAFQRHNLNAYSKYQSKKLSTDLFIQLSDVHAFIPSSLSFDTFQNSPEEAAGNWLAVNGFEEYKRILFGLKNELKIHENFKANLILFGNSYKGYESRPFNILEDDSFQIGLRANFHYSRNRWEIKTGIEYIYESYNWNIFNTLQGEQGALLNSYEEERKPVNLFFSLGHNWEGGTVLEAGLSFNLLNYDLIDISPASENLSGEYKFSSIFSPFIGINHPLSKHINIYASIGHGFSYPTVEETLLPDGQVNPELKPESGLSFEWGARLSSTDGNLYIDAGTYLMFINDLLVTERITEDIFTGKNAGKTKHLGFEFQAAWRMNQNQEFSLPKTTLDLSFSSSRNSFSEFVDDGMDHSGNKLPGVPGNTFHAGIDLSYKFGLYTQFDFNYTGNQYLDDQNSQSYEGFSFTNLKIGYRFKSEKYGADIYAGISNLFDQAYASMLLVNAPSFGGNAPGYYYPGQPRNYFIGFSASF